MKLKTIMNANKAADVTNTISGAIDTSSGGSFVVYGDTNTISGAFNESFGINPVITGVILAVLTAIVIFGGIKRIGEVCGLLSPFMAGAYLFCGLLIIVLHIGQVPAAIGLIIKAAFAPQAALGGAAGFTVMTAIRYGMARGIFTRPA